MRKKGIVVLLAVIVGIGGVSGVSAKQKRTGDSVERVNICVFNSIAGGSTPYTVPTDRQLIIEDASTQVYLRTGEWAIVRLLTKAGARSAGHTIAALSATHGFAYYSAGRTMKLYADPGTEVSMDAGWGSFQSVSASVCFSGLLEPVQ
jgi:hypothetical protein